jgi:hypothetical protein
MLYKARAFLSLLKTSFPQVIFRKFKGHPTGGDNKDMDLIFINHQNTSSSILNLLLDAFAHILITKHEQNARVTIPRHNLYIDLTPQKKGFGKEPAFNTSFETSTKKLVALLRFSAIDPRWISGTQAGINPKNRFAFFISHPTCYRGHKGIRWVGVKKPLPI